MDLFQLVDKEEVNEWLKHHERGIMSRVNYHLNRHNNIYAIEHIMRSRGIHVYDKYTIKYRSIMEEEYEINIYSMRLSYYRGMLDEIFERYCRQHHYYLYREGPQNITYFSCIHVKDIFIKYYYDNRDNISFCEDKKKNKIMVKFFKNVLKEPIEEPSDISHLIYNGKTLKTINDKYKLMGLNDFSQMTIMLSSINTIGGLFEKNIILQLMEYYLFGVKFIDDEGYHIIFDEPMRIIDIIRDLYDDEKTQRLHRTLTKKLKPSEAEKIDNYSEFVFDTVRKIPATYPLFAIRNLYVKEWYKYDSLDGLEDIVYDCEQSSKSDKFKHKLKKGNKPKFDDQYSRSDIVDINSYDKHIKHKKGYRMVTTKQLLRYEGIETMDHKSFKYRQFWY